MAFSATGASGEYHILADILLDSTTLRYADEDISIQSSNSCGHFYEGKLLPGSIVRQMNSAIEPIERIEVYNLVLDNRDNEIASMIYNGTFANKEVNIYLGEGESRANYSNVLPGIVAYPNGIRWDEDTATITVVDRRIRDRRVLPDTRFEADDFPFIEQKSRSQPAPIVYGDWRYSVGDEIGVPAYCVNTNTNTFRCAGHDIKQIQRVVKNAVALNLTTQVTGVTASTAQFSIHQSVGYNATSDIISVNVQGHQTINGTLIENPQDILKHMYTRYCDLTGTDLNVTAFHSLGDDVDSLFRRCVTVQTTTETLVGELLNEAQIDMRFVNGKYSPKYRGLDLEANRPDMREDDIVIDDDEKAVFSVEYDPERYYCNQIIANYDWDPVDQQWNHTHTVDATTAQARVNALVQRTWDMGWVYQRTDAVNRGVRELIRYSSEPITVDAMFTNRQLTRNLADQFDLTYSVFSNWPFQVQRMDTDLINMTTRIRGEDMYGMAAIGRWTGDAAPSWVDSARTDKLWQGYWTDDVGYANPADYTSIYWSVWY
jgi:hypothetical protein